MKPSPPPHHIEQSGEHPGSNASISALLGQREQWHASTAALSGGFRQLLLRYISRMGKKGSEREETLLLDHLVSNPRCAVTQVLSGALTRCVLVPSNFLDNHCRSTTAAPKIFHLLRTSGCHSAPQEPHVPFGSLALWNYQGRWSVSSLPVLCERVIGRCFLWDFCPYPDS